MTNQHDDIWCGRPWPPAYDLELDTTTPQGKARREREEKSLQEHLAARAKFYEDNPDEVDIDSLVDDHYAALVEHHAGCGPYPIGPLFKLAPTAAE